MDYTCVDYRAEMILLGLKRRLQNEELTDKEREDILSEIRKLETAIGLG